MDKETKLKWDARVHELSAMRKWQLTEILDQIRADRRIRVVLSATTRKEDLISEILRYEFIDIK